jgi:hypothetical protein
MAFDALKYDDIVLINAPFTKEIHDLAPIFKPSGKSSKKML